METNAKPEPEKPLNAGDGGGRTCPIPPRQRPYKRAYELGFDELLAREPSDETLSALGVVREQRIIRVPALGRQLLVDLDKRQITSSGGVARIGWAVLVLHYLLADDTSLDTREVSFGNFPECRGYLDVFRKRIIGRFLHTVGRTSEQFEQASEQLNAARVSGPGTAYRFDVLPRVPITIIRHDGDEELGPDANVTYREDAARLLPTEDCVVVAELLLDTLSGVPIHESPGGGDERRH